MSSASCNKKEDQSEEDGTPTTGAENQRKPSNERERTPQESNQSNGEDRTSIVSIVCRICFDDNKDETIITPCKCKGTVAFVHRSCLEKWLSESNTTACELCSHVYETERVPKYTAKESIWRWLRYQPTNLGFRVRHVRCDLIACSVLTPLAIVITYICLFSADYYNQQRFQNIPTARWTSVSLLIMIAIMLFGYYIWVYVVVGYHGRMWYYWWQRECIVRYIPPGPAGSMIAPPPVVLQGDQAQVTMVTIENDTHNQRNTQRQSDTINEIVSSAHILTSATSGDPSLASCKSIHESNV